MKKTTKKILAILFAAAVMAAVPAAAGICGNISASANSAPAYWYGSDGTGVVPAEENCPVEVEREALTLEIPSLPKASYSSQAEFDTYEARFTAEYTFYNPTDEPLTVELAFPFGTAPEYIYTYSQDAGKTPFDDSARYGVTVGGEDAETELRYTYYNGGSELTIPAKEKREECLFKEDADLYEFSYAASAGVDLYNGNYYIEVCLSYSTARTRILCDHYRDYLLEDGNLVLLLYLNDKDDPVNFFAVGEKPQIKYTKVAKQGSGLASGKRTYVEDAQIQTSERCTMFRTWVVENRPNGVGEIDWYNAAIAYLESRGVTNFGLTFAYLSSLSEEDLMRWLCYSLEIPAKGRVVNTVIGPLYPDVTAYSYRYRYLLSPAQAWAKFGEFSLTITTPYTVEECGLSLEKTEGGYAFAREGLPLGELEFTIQSKSVSAPHSVNAIVVDLLFIVFPVSGLSITAITFAVYFIRRKKKRSR